MSICSYCYKSNVVSKHDVSHWWNCPSDTDYVCSDECYAKLEKLVEDGTWMHYKPPAMFPNATKKKKVNGPTSLTDTQFKSS